MRRTTVWMAAVLLTLTFAGVSHAAATITYDTDPPSDLANYAQMCDIVIPDPTGYSWSHGTGTTLDIGQTFILTRNAVLDELTIRMRQNSGLSGEGVSLTFFEVGSSDEDPISFDVGVMPLDLPVGQDVYLTFDFPDQAFVSGVEYGFLLEIRGGGAVSDASATVYHVEGDQCAAGNAFQVAAADTITLPDDLVFYLHAAEQTVGPTLSLQEGRFEVSATWTDFDGQSGEAMPVALTDESGYFWFFDEDNVELVIKVLDACDGFDRFWVFAAGLTNVALEIEVVDLATTVTWTSSSSLGSTFETVLDTDAFDTCP